MHKTNLEYFGKARPTDNLDGARKNCLCGSTPRVHVHIVGPGHSVRPAIGAHNVQRGCELTEVC